MILYSSCTGVSLGHLSEQSVAIPSLAAMPSGITADTLSPLTPNHWHIPGGHWFLSTVVLLSRMSSLCSRVSQWAARDLLRGAPQTELLSAQSCLYLHLSQDSDLNCPRKALPTSVPTLHLSQASLPINLSYSLPYVSQRTWPDTEVDKFPLTVENRTFLTSRNMTCCEKNTYPFFCIWFSVTQLSTLTKSNVLSYCSF
jgi:hypothetical protein